MEIRKFGTERCRLLLEMCGNPDGKLKIVHIAGTNGKGSTATFISSVIAAAGKRVGTFTSPQVFCYEEGFRIDLQPAASDKISAYKQRVLALAESMEDAPSPFEVETAAAILMFFEEGCEYAVLECGLGGRDDATNAVRAKAVAVFTSISMEHTAELGSTITEICSAKSGIIKDCPAVVSAYQSAEGRAFFEKKGAIFAGDGLKILSRSPYGQIFEYKGATYEISLHGDAQCYNAATAAEACAILGFSQSDIKSGLRSARISGRAERIETSHGLYIIDGAHNPAAFAPLCDLLARTQGSRRLIFGCLSDKDVDNIARILSGYFISVTLVVPDSQRAMDIEKMEKAFGRCFSGVSSARSVSEALEGAKADVIVVCGTFTILKEAREWIEKRQ